MIAVNSFGSMVQELTTKPALTKSKVPLEQYEQWQHGYLFDALRNLKYGQSFCKRFGISDNILNFELDRAIADSYIRLNYVEY